jgi:hypothetical protein
MAIPIFLQGIADAIAEGHSRRLKVRTIMAHYGLKRRRATGMEAIRADLKALGLTTYPDFELVDFDQQVRFLPVGAGSDDGDDTNDELDSQALFRFNVEPGTPPCHRVIFRTYDAFERFRAALVEGRQAKVFQNGQNPRREDRDLFPFHLVIQLNDAFTEEDLAAWLAEAVRLSEELEPLEEEPDSVPDTRSDYFDPVDFQERMTHLHHAIKADFESEMGDLRTAMERKVDEIRFDAIQKLARQINDDEALKVIDEFESEMRGKLKSKDGELRDKQKEINLLQAQLADLEQEQLERDEYDPADAYPTLVAALRLFSDICVGSPIDVNETAYRSVQRSACIRRRELLQFLLTLRELAEILYCREGPGKPIKNWFSERGYEYAKSDSETTATKFGDEREIQIGETRVQLQEHVTLFPNTRDCLSIYFARDSEINRLVVGYVGPHLRTVGR